MLSKGRPYWGLVEKNVSLSFLVATPLFQVTWLQDNPLFAEIDPQLATPPPVHVGAGQGVAVYGERPPTPVDLNDLCPPPEACPECHVPKEAKCNDGGIALFHLVGRMEIKPFANATYPGLPSRVLDCQLYAVGKPVYHRNTEALYGSWMRDPMPVMETLGEKLWVTKENDTYHLFEYSNKTMFRRDIATKRYKLDHPFKGNAHVVYNGSFYYNERDKPRMLRFDLKSESYRQLDVPLLITNNSNYLYTTENNYMDFSVDDNGLWVLYGLSSDNNNTVVMKVDAYTMKIQYMWNISIDHHIFGEMFIVCGVLYAVDSVKEKNTKISYDLGYTFEDL
uniref:Olfactomedin-like domain-containing protein n=1 Tax=Timema monikensis TaxID=170555 RepID=A0A7R9E9S1_9NEOP|nr:unnamed protein product [Timema monikensis]